MTQDELNVLSKIDSKTIYFLPDSGQLMVNGEYYGTQFEVFNCRGKFVNGIDASYSISGVGNATVTLFPNHKARIDFTLKITTSGYSSDFNFGISEKSLRDASKNGNIPKLTPIYGGQCTYYTADGIVSSSLNGFGGAFDTISTPDYWRFARVYTEAGAIGAWPESQISEGMRINGTCYASY